MDCATLLRANRERAGLSQRELAKRASTSAAAICLYETGKRIPRVDTMARLLAATGATFVIDAFTAHEIDVSVNGKILKQVLDLSDYLPHRRPGELAVPVFAEQVR